MTKNIYTHYVNDLPEVLVADDHYFVKTGAYTANHYIGANDGSAILVSVVTSEGIGLGDMTKAIYDTNDDGVVDHAATATTASNAESLGGESASAYALKTDIPEVSEGGTDESFAIAMAIAL